MKLSKDISTIWIRPKVTHKHVTLLVGGKHFPTNKSSNIKSTKMKQPKKTQHNGSSFLSTKKTIPQNTISPLISPFFSFQISQTVSSGFLRCVYTTGTGHLRFLQGQTQFHLLQINSSEGQETTVFWWGHDVRALHLAKKCGPQNWVKPCESTI